MEQLSEKLPSWDLTAYYKDYKDAAIKSDLVKAAKEVKSFVNKYRGKVSDLSEKGVGEFLKDYQEVYEVLYKAQYYLMHVYDVGGESVEEIEQLLTQITGETAQIATGLVFVTRELMDREDLAELIKSVDLSEYSYYFERLLLDKKHTLSEEVEQVIALKDVTGFDAWAKYYKDQTSKIDIEGDLEGELKKYRFPDLVQLMKHNDRSIRKAAYELRAQALAEKEENVLAAYNNVLMERKLSDELRGYKSAEEQKANTNQVTQEFVDSLIVALQEKQPMVKRMLKLKQEMLGLDEKMHMYDVSAVVNLTGGDKKYSWSEAKKIILDAFGEFDPEFRKIATMFFDNNWIDADPSLKRRRSGAYQSDFTPNFHPIIFTNYQGTMTDVITLAHELGHGIHSYLMMSNQCLINCEYPMSTAEIASTACETVVFNKLYESLDSLPEKLNLLAWKIDTDAIILFQVGIGRYMFEKKAHEKFRKDGPLSVEYIRELCTQEVYAMIYGDLVEYDEGTGHNWQYVAHNIYIFYNYVYASGNLLALSIYNLISQDNSKLEIYKDMLKSGGSMSPKDLLAKLGLDIETPGVWESGFEQVENSLALAEELWEEYQTN